MFLWIYEVAHPLTKQVWAAFILWDSGHEAEASEIQLANEFWGSGMHMLCKDAGTFSSLNLLEPNPCLGIGNQFSTITSLNPQENRELPMTPVQFLTVLSVDSKKFQFLKHNQTMFSIRCHQIISSFHNFFCPFLTPCPAHFFLPVSCMKSLAA